MRKRGARLPSPAMAVAFLALLAALTGTAVALPGSNTVTSGDIRPGAVTSSDIRNNSVRSGDVRNNTLTGTDVNDNSLTGSDVNEGSLGAVPLANRANGANIAGFAIAANTAGRANSAASADALGSLVVRTSLDIPNPSGSQDSGEVACPAGTFPLGGGFWASASGVGQNANSSFPQDDAAGNSDPDDLPDGWFVWMDNDTGSAEEFNVYVICAAATSVTSDPLFPAGPTK